MFENDENESHSFAFGLKNKKHTTTEKPWYKPRKQWIREKQWKNKLFKLLTNNSACFSTDSTIRYFGLPGGDLLDVDYIANEMLNEPALSHKEFFVHGLVSNQSEKYLADSRLSSLLDQKNISPDSIVENYNFKTLKQKNSVLWEKIKQFSPYHFVNLDFCSNIVEEDTISAIYNLLEYQFKHHIDRPWVFCLTTNVNSNSGEENSLVKLYNLINSDEFNINEHFAALYTALNENKTINEIREDSHLFSDFLIVGLIIWLTQFSEDNNVKYKLSSSVKYHVTGNEAFPDIYSFVFEFKTQFISSPDRSGLVTSDAADKVISPTPSELRNNILQKLSTTFDLDEYFRNHPDKLQEYDTHTSDLLKRCGVHS